MLPPVTRNVHSPHASFSNAWGKARHTSRRRFIARLESSYIRGCAMSESSDARAVDLSAAVRQRLVYGFRGATDLPGAWRFATRCRTDPGPSHGGRHKTCR